MRCTLVEREAKSFQVTTKTVHRTRRITKTVWYRVPGRRAFQRKGPTTEHRTMYTATDYTDVITGIESASSMLAASGLVPSVQTYACTPETRR